MSGRSEEQHRRVPKDIQYRLRFAGVERYSANLCDGLCELTVHDRRHYNLTEGIYFSTGGICLSNEKTDDLLGTILLFFGCVPKTLIVEAKSHARITQVLARISWAKGQVDIDATEILVGRGKNIALVSESKWGVRIA